MSKEIKLVIQLTEDRITRVQLFLGMARLMSYRGTCRRGQHACIITQNNRVVSSGYNGSIIPKWVCKEQCDINHKCTHAVHAEANAIAAAAREGISLKGATLYCTANPCFECAKLIIQAGIKVVVYSDDYNTDKKIGLDLLQENHVEVYQHTI